MRTIRGLSRLDERLWFVEGPFSNWTILSTAAGVTLIDAGFPADAPLVIESIRAAGLRPEALTTILVTHAHPDHIGGIPALLAQAPGVEVLTPAADLEAARGPEREQMTPAKAGLRFLRPRFAAWAVGAARSGGTRAFTIPSARAFTAEELATAGIHAIPAPGHTPGSTMYELPEHDVLITGDAFVTGHQSYARPRAGVFDAVFNADDATARATAARVPTNRTILPGHGPLLRPRG